jgi:scyllo-inositol 2-dehydrogenase (NADP+)
MKTKIRTALLGLGLSGKVFHAPFLINNDFFSLDKILSSKNLQQQFPNATIVKSIEEVMNDKNIDLIINTLPNEMHYNVSKAALLNGKHVVIEKPFANNSTEALDLIETSKKQNKILSVFHNRRWDGDFLQLKKCVSENKLGNIHFFESRFDRFKPQITENWRDQKKEGSGIVYDLGVHLIDQAIQLFGVPKSLFCDITTYRPNALTDDGFSITFFYPSLRVNLSANVFMKHPTPRFQVFGDQSSFKSMELDPQEKLLKAQVAIDSEDWRKSQENFKYTLGDAQEQITHTAGSYKSFYEQLGKAITENDSSLNPVSPESALLNITLLEKCFESFKSKKVIFLP